MDNPTRREFLKLLGKGVGAAAVPKIAGSPLLNVLKLPGVSDDTPLDGLQIQILKRLKEAGGDTKKVYDAAKFGIDKLGLGIAPTSGIEKRDASAEIEQIPVDFYFDPRQDALVSKYEHKGKQIRKDVGLQEKERVKGITAQPEEMSNLVRELNEYIYDQALTEASEAGATPGEEESFDPWSGEGSSMWKEFSGGLYDLERAEHDAYNWRQTIDSFGGVDPYVEDLEDRLTQGMASSSVSGRSDYSMQSIQDDLFNKLGISIPTKNTEAWMADFTDPSNVKKRRDKLFDTLSQVANFIPAGRILKGGSRLFNTLLKGEVRDKARKRKIPQLEYKPQEPFNPVETKQADKVHVPPSDKKPL